MMWILCGDSQTDLSNCYFLLTRSSVAVRHKNVELMKCVLTSFFHRFEFILCCNQGTKKKGKKMLFDVKHAFLNKHHIKCILLIKQEKSIFFILSLNCHVERQVARMFWMICVWCIFDVFHFNWKNFSAIIITLLFIILMLIVHECDYVFNKLHSSE